MTENLSKKIKKEKQDEKRAKIEQKEKIDELPKKKNYRMRAHCNVLADVEFE